MDLRLAPPLRGFTHRHQYASFDPVALGFQQNALFVCRRDKFIGLHVCCRAIPTRGHWAAGTVHSVQAPQDTRIIWIVSPNTQRNIEFPIPPLEVTSRGCAKRQRRMSVHAKILQFATIGLGLPAVSGLLANVANDIVGVEPQRAWIERNRRHKCHQPHGRAREGIDHHGARPVRRATARIPGGFASTQPGHASRAAQFIRIYRLNPVRPESKRLDPPKGQVCMGFSPMGMFAKDYRHWFGEFRSETRAAIMAYLRRNAANNATKRGGDNAQVSW
jgi:hypothetical protein